MLIRNLKCGYHFNEAIVFSYYRDYYQFYVSCACTVSDVLTELAIPIVS